MLSLPLIRAILYGFLFIFSFVLLALCCVRLQYTLNLAKTDPLNGGTSFYDPDAALLLVCAIFSVLAAPFVIYVILWHRDFKYATRTWTEALLLFFLWLLYITGAAIASSYWGSLLWCQIYIPCRILTALVAFAWLAWISLTALLALTLIVAFSKGEKGWNTPMHGEWQVGEKYPQSEEVENETTTTGPGSEREA